MEARRCRLWEILAATFLLCLLAVSLTFFSLHTLSQAVTQADEVSEPKVLQVSRGSVLFNGQKLEFHSSLGSTTAERSLLIDSGQSDQKVASHDSTNEAGWRHLNTSLHCGHNNMTLEVDGPHAAELQLDLVHTHSLPVIQVPESCGFSVRQNPLGLVLVVQYDGCNVRRENGRYVLPLRWQQTTVNFTCAMLGSPPTPMTIPEPQGLKNAPLRHSQWRLHRSKRHVKWPVQYRCFPYYPYDPYFRQAYIPPTPTTATTTVQQTTVKPPVNLDFWRQLLELYPVYARYLAKNQIPVNVLLDYYKNQGWQVSVQGPEKAKVSHNPLQHLLGQQLRSGQEPPTPSSPTPLLTTPCKLKPTPRNLAYPDLQNGFDYFYRNPLIQSIFKKRVPYQDYKPGPRAQGLPESYWQFPASFAQ